MNDFEDEKESASKEYMGIVTSPSEQIPSTRYGLYYLNNYVSPEKGTISVDTKQPFIYIHHCRFTEDLKNPVKQRILKFYPKGLEGTKRNTVPLKDNQGDEVASLVLGCQAVHKFGKYECYPVDYEITDKNKGISRIHAIILGIDSVILDKQKPMKVIDFSNSLDYSGFAIKRAKDFEITSSTVLKAVGQEVILKVLEANSEWVTFEASLAVKFDGQKSFKVKKTHKITPESSNTGEWIIMDTSSDPGDTSFVEIFPYNMVENASIGRADSPNMLGWLVYDGKEKRWLIRNNRNKKEASGLWLLSKNETIHDLGGQYTLYYEDYLMIHKHLFVITDDYKFNVF